MNENEITTDGLSELRIYGVVRDDLNIDPLAYMALAAAGVAHLRMAANANPQLAEGYHPQTQPKLILRARNAADMERAIAEVTAAGLPHVSMSAEGLGEVGMFLAPLTREALPRHVSKMRLFEEPRVPVSRISSAFLVEGQSGDLTVNVVSELNAPLGKMMAQVGHAAWSGCADLEAVPTVAVSVSHQYFVQQGAVRGGGVITDAGRTVFDKPTVTCCWGHYPTIRGDALDALPGLTFREFISVAKTPTP